MTLIAISVKPGSVEFVTDTYSYSRHAETLGQAVKAVTIPHLDTAILAQGDSAFGIGAKIGLLHLADESPTFDQLLADAPELLTGTWANRTEDATDSIVFLAGYSHEDGAFAGYYLASEYDFLPMPIGELFVTPSPWTMAPSDIEVERFTTAYPDHTDVLQTWMGKPDPTAPSGVKGWRDLAITVREQRALEHFAHVIVAGKVIHTQLTRGRIHTRTIHEFNDSGEEFNELVRWTQHPQALAQDCHCGSGQAFGQCCGHLKGDDDARRAPRGANLASSA